MALAALLAKSAASTAAAAPAPLYGEPLSFTVVGLAGDTIAAPTLLTCQTVSDLKAAVHKERPSANPSWQRLLIHGRMLEDDTESLESFSSPEVVPVQLVLAVEPWDIVRGGPEVAVEAAQSLDSLGPALPPHIMRLFEDEAGETVTASAAQDTMYAMAQRLTWGTKAGPLPHLRAALMPHALRMLESEGLLQPHRRTECCIVRIFDFLGSQCAPRLVAWLRLQARPLREDLRWRAEQLRQHSDSTKVRVAAKAALNDQGLAPKVRIEELVALRRSLGREAATVSDCEERRTLRELLARAEQALQDFTKQTLEPHVRYALSKALKR